jgi:hypothetical protein
MYDDWQIFVESPLFGAGPGLGQAARMGMVAHTEFSRMLSEHGSFGLLALAIMASLPILRVRNAASELEKGYALALVVWTFLYMAANGMRLAAPSFAYGLAFARALAPAAGRLKRWRYAA